MSLLSVKNLCVGFSDRSRNNLLVEDVSFDLNPGETLGFVGESGSGKSVTSLSLLELLPESLMRRSGHVFWEGKSLEKFSASDREGLRGQKAAMIFQNPLSSLHPCYRIEKQIYECFKLGKSIPENEYRNRAIALMKEVGILEPEQRLRAYPHELSGGMAQRVVIAMALARNPSVLIADEPTTALDVTIQAQVLRKILELQKQRQLALILVSHDLGVIAHMTQKILVFYAGEIVESGSTSEVLQNPKHPYTKALLNCRPRSSEAGFPFIPGQVPHSNQWGDSCRFASRCEKVQPSCRKTKVPWTADSGGGFRCLFPLTGHAHLNERSSHV